MKSNQHPTTVTAANPTHTPDAGAHQIVLRFLAEPGDINFGGKVHGGAVMKWIDQAGYACATQWAGSYCVTVYVGGIRFYRPIQIGNMVEVEAHLIYTGRSSLHMAIDVRARDPKSSTFTKTTHCIIIFVAVNAEGARIPIRPWVPVTSEQVAWHEHAVKLMEMRKSLEEEHLRVDPERPGKFSSLPGPASH